MRKGQGTRVRVVAAIAVIAATWIGVGVALRPSAPEPLGQVAERAFPRILDGDADQILELVPEEEREGNRLTKASVSRVLRSMILPRVAKWGAPLREEGFDHGHQGGRTRTFRNDHEWGINVVRRDGKPMSGLSTLLVHTWIGAYIDAHPAPFTLERRNLGILEGLSRDGAQLRALGWKRLYMVDVVSGEVVQIPLDDAERFFRQELEDARRKTRERNARNARVL